MRSYPTCIFANLRSYKELVTLDLVITFDWGVLLTQGQRVWTAFCKILSGTPHLTIFGALKYAPKYSKYGKIYKICLLCASIGRWKMQVCVIFGHQGLPNTSVSWVFLSDKKHWSLKHPEALKSGCWGGYCNKPANRHFFGTPYDANSSGSFNRAFLLKRLEMQSELFKWNSDYSSPLNISDRKS